LFPSVSWSAWYNGLQCPGITGGAAIWGNNPTGIPLSCQNITYNETNWIYFGTWGDTSGTFSVNYAQSYCTNQQQYECSVYHNSINNRWYMRFAVPSPTPCEGMDGYQRYSLSNSGEWFNFAPSCPVDNDGDGFGDYWDLCPTEPGTDAGCPAEPSTCQNGVQDGDETGQDCGGSCVIECSEVCPPGYQWLTDDCQGGGSKCTWLYSGDVYGGCQPGSYGLDTYCSDSPYVQDGSFSDYCISFADTVSQAADPDADPSEPSPDNPAGNTSDTSQATDPPTQPAQETQSTDTQISETDNGDGTVTRVTNITINKTSPSGSGTTTTETTRTEVIDSATGKVLSSNETTNTTLPPEENPDNYDYSLSSPDYQGYSSADAPGEQSITGLLESWVSSNPVTDEIKKAQIITTNEAACFDYTYKSSLVSFCFDKPFMSNFYIVFKGILISLASIVGIFIIFKR